jgi:hypothetical protein
MKEEVKKNNVASIIFTREFAEVLRQIRTTYPDDGGRSYINSLVACHQIVNPE